MLKDFKYKSDYNNHIKYNRTFIKKLPEEVTKLPFRKCYKPSDWDEDYISNNRKLQNALRRFFYSKIGDTYNNIFNAFLKIKAYSKKKMIEDLWDFYIEEKYLIFDENNFLIEYNPQIYQRFKPETVAYSLNQLKHNDEEIKKIPKYNKFRKTPHSNIISPMRGMKKLGKFYISYKGKAVLVDLFIHPVYDKYKDWHHQIMKKGYGIIESVKYIHGIKIDTYRNIQDYFWDYYPKRVGTNIETNEPVFKNQIGNLGYGNLLEIAYFFVNQAEKQLSRTNLN